jgi:hypothetical protein
MYVYIYDARIARCRRPLTQVATGLPVRIPSGTDRNPGRTVHIREHLRQAVSGAGGLTLPSVGTVQWTTPRALQELVHLGLACAREDGDRRPALMEVRRELWALLARMDRPGLDGEVRGHACVNGVFVCVWCVYVWGVCVCVVMCMCMCVCVCVGCMCMCMRMCGLYVYAYVWCVGCMCMRACVLGTGGRSKNARTRREAPSSS